MPATCKARAVSCLAVPAGGEAQYRSMATARRPLLGCGFHDMRRPGLLYAPYHGRSSFSVVHR